MYNISLITGDGIGPEISKSGLEILNKINDDLNLKFSIKKIEAGDELFKKTGKALSDDAITTIKNTHACLKAPIGESAYNVIVVLRRLLKLYANIRPIKSYANITSIKPNIDFVIVRENTEDLYVRKEFEIDDYAIALRLISKQASNDIAKYAFEIAKHRKKHVVCVHKSNVLRKTDGLFVNTCSNISKLYNNIKFESMYVDACAMNIVKKPEYFDVIVTTNMFGDILSDEAAQVAGSLGLAPSANIGDKYAIFEPIHGAAFDIAGKNIANPTSFILSIKMMLEWFGIKYNDKNAYQISQKLENIISNILKNNIKTKDIGGNRTTEQFTNEIIKKLE